MNDSVPGLRWVPNGQSVLFGPLLALAERLDGHFLALSSQWQAEDHRFPAFLPATVLERIDWFRSFPQLATFPACLDVDEADLARFTEGEPVTSDGAVHPTDLATIRDVLTPAACYHLYDHFSGRLLGDRQTFELLASGVGAFGGGLVRASLQSVVPFARQLFVAKQVDNRRLRDALGDTYRAPDAAALVRRTCDQLVATGSGRRAVA